MSIECRKCGLELTDGDIGEHQAYCFECREGCPSCGGTGKVWVAVGEDDGCYEPCDECFEWNEGGK